MRTLDVLSDRVCIELAPRSQFYPGTEIEIPERFRKAEEWGTVRAVGPETKDLTVGVKAMVKRTDGHHFTEGVREYVILREGQVVAMEAPE